MHIFNTRTLDQAVAKKLRAGKKITDETKADFTKGEQAKSFKHESFYFRELFGMLGLELQQENLTYNAKEKQRLENFIQNHLEKHEIVNKET